MARRSGNGPLYDAGAAAPRHGRLVPQPTMEVASPQRRTADVPIRPHDRPRAAVLLLRAVGGPPYPWNTRGGRAALLAPPRLAPHRRYGCRCAFVVVSARLWGGAVSRVTVPRSVVLSLLGGGGLLLRVLRQLRHLLQQPRLLVEALRLCSEFSRGLVRRAGSSAYRSSSWSGNRICIWRYDPSQSSTTPRARWTERAS